MSIKHNFVRQITTIIRIFTFSVENLPQSDRVSTPHPNNNQSQTAFIIIIRLGLNVALTHQNRSYRDNPDSKLYLINMVYWGIAG